MNQHLQEHLADSRISQAYYSDLFEGIGAAVLVVDPGTGAILDANPVACSFYGYSHAELTQLKILDLAAIPPDEVYERVRKIAAGEITYMTLPHRLASGEIREVEVYLGRSFLRGQPVNIATVHDITARKQAESQLRESEARYQALFDYMREGFSLNEIIQDEEGRVVDFLCLDANAAYELHTGQKREQAIGRTIRESMPDVDPQMIQRYGQVALTGEPLVFEYYSNTFKRHLRVHAFRPQPRRFAVIFEDVTHVRESEARYSIVFQSSHDAISIARLEDGVYLDVNEAFCTLFGVTREQAIGHTSQELSIAANPAQLDELRQKIRSQGWVKNFEAPYRNHVGQERYVLVSGGLAQVHGQTCVVMFGKEITLRKQAEMALQAAHDELEQRVEERTAALQHSLERLDLATRSAEMGIWDWDIQKNELVWDDQMYALYGLQPGEFGGAYEAWLQGVHPEDRGPSNEISQLAVRGERPYDTEFRVLWPDGSVHWLKADARVFWDAQGHPTRMVGINYDITKHKLADQALRQTQQELQANAAQLEQTNQALQKALRAKDEFMSAMSHELRTPLAGILGLTEVLQQTASEVLSEKQRRHLTNIQKSGERLLELVNHILEYTSLQSGTLIPTLLPCALDELCQMALQNIAPSPRKNNSTPNSPCRPRI
ncbi:MAG TPA: PAS domain S-box protein [Anaerolineales bacterium]|nr:PAS domain S-box protein [Anaerolineales bacterium]